MPEPSGASTHSQQPSPVQSTLGQLAVHILANAFEGCEVEGCKHKSLGFVCSDCSRYVCQSHYYLSPTPQIPPKVVCVRCILLRAYREPLLEADFIEPGPSKRSAP